MYKPVKRAKVKKEIKCFGFLYVIGGFSGMAYELIFGKQDFQEIVLMIGLQIIGMLIFIYAEVKD